MKKNIIYLLITFSLCIPCLLLMFLIYNKPEYDFTNNDFEHVEIKGTVYIKGYISIKQLDKDIGVIDGDKYDYLMFNIIDTKSNEFYEFLKDFKGNSFVGDNSIGIGCFDDNKIHYSNNSADFGEKNYSLTKKDSKKIINSTQDKPVILKLYFGGRTLGKCAPTCYSHISNIEVLE